MRDLYEAEDSQDVAFEEIYNLFYKPGVAFLITIVKDLEEAENLVQEVFIKIWLRKDKMVLDNSLKPYIFTCLKNIAFDYLRRIEKEDSIKQLYFEQMKEAPNYDFEQGEFSEIVNQAVDKLSEKRKMIIKLNFEDGKSYQEIAQIMSISKNTVKNQLIKAKQHLKSSIEYPLVLR